MVLVGCENVRSDQLAIRSKGDKEMSTPTFLSGNTKKAESQKNTTIITLLMMLGLLSAQLTPVNSMSMNKCEATWNNKKDQIKGIRTLSYKRLPLLFATEDVDTTTDCSLEASDISTLECQNNCTNRLHKLLANEKIKKLMNRYNSTSNNNTAILYQRNNKIRKENGDNYPEVAFTYKKNGTVIFYGWKNRGQQHLYKSIPDEIKKISAIQDSTRRITELEKLVALLMNCAFTNDPSNQISLLKPTLEKWCNERNHDAAMGLIEAIEQIVKLIEIEETLQNLETTSHNKENNCCSQNIISKNTELINQNSLWKSLLCDSYKKGFVTLNELELKKSNCNKEEFQFSKSNKNGQLAQRKKRQIEEKYTQSSKQNWKNTFFPHNTKQRKRYH
ncbi:MAG: hypothetical protein NQ127_00845 [Candidatus Cardinium sp.]|nr:hypothetical protein [Candidatus Cardinium sp.]